MAKFNLVREDVVSDILQKAIYEIAVKLNDTAEELTKIEPYGVTETDVLSRAKLLRALHDLQEDLETPADPTKSQIAYTRGYSEALFAVTAWAMEQIGEARV